MTHRIWTLAAAGALTLSMVWGAMVWGAMVGGATAAPDAKLIQRLAEQGNPAFMSVLALMYERGDGAPQDYPEAILWYDKAARLGDPDAQTALGSLYERGLGTPRDYGLALYWYRQAAEQGWPRAEQNLANLYESGRLGAPDAKPLNGPPAPSPSVRRPNMGIGVGTLGSRRRPGQAASNLSRRR